jgi:hypothetical protein
VVEQLAVAQCSICLVSCVERERREQVRGSKRGAKKKKEKWRDLMYAASQQLCRTHTHTIVKCCSASSRRTKCCQTTPRPAVHALQRHTPQQSARYRAGASTVQWTFGEKKKNSRICAPAEEGGSGVSAVTHTCRAASLLIGLFCCCYGCFIPRVLHLATFALHSMKKPSNAKLDGKQNWRKERGGSDVLLLHSSERNDVSKERLRLMCCAGCSHNT